MRELKLDLHSLYPTLPEPWDYEYAILVDQVEVGAFSCESYGVSIVNRRTGERADVPNITVSVPRIDELVEKLVRCQVSPVHLRDVVDDWL